MLPSAGAEGEGLIKPGTTHNATCNPPFSRNMLDIPEYTADRCAGQVIDCRVSSSLISRFLPTQYHINLRSILSATQVSSNESIICSSPAMPPARRSTRLYEDNQYLASMHA